MPPKTSAPLATQSVSDALSLSTVCTWLLVHEEWRKKWNMLIWNMGWTLFAPKAHDRRPSIFHIHTCAYKTGLMNWKNIPDTSHTPKKKFNSSILLFSVRFCDKRESSSSHPILYALLGTGVTGVFTCCLPNTRDLQVTNRLSFLSHILFKYVPYQFQFSSLYSTHYELKPLFVEHCEVDIMLPLC